MKIINAGYKIITLIDGQVILKRIEEVGRVCYKSEGKIKADSYKSFVGMLIARGHEAMLEHCSFTVKFICDRGVSHEIVRHRIASYAQESTRYCNYGNEITVIMPCFRFDAKQYELWYGTMMCCEANYRHLIKSGAKPEEARSVLPNSLKTELVVTMNLREWRHFLKLRTADTAHPQMREITRPLLAELKTLVPVVFDDIEVTPDE